MKLVVFSDIHGNMYAFDEFVKALNIIEYDKVIFCGDIFGYYYDQEYILNKLMKMKNLIWLKGNHDEYFMNIYRGISNEKGYIDKYGHSYQNLNEKFSDKILQLVGQLPSAKELEFDNKKIGIFHGTPENHLMGRLYPNNVIENQDAYLKYDVVILGHTHFRMERYVKNTWIINPGSLGQPRDGKGYSYAEIDLLTNKIAFKNVTFDKTELYKKIDYYDMDLSKLKTVLERKELRY